jgi:hypothetical protein
VLVGLSPWELAATVTAGRLLGPSSMVEVRNTSSRAVMGAGFGYHEDTVRLAAASRPALAARGVPEQIYPPGRRVAGPCRAW